MPSNGGEPSSPSGWKPPPPNYRTAPIPNQESIHNHYYPAEQGPVRWYRRKRWFWTVVGGVAFLVVAIAVVLGVVLKLELKKDGGRGEAETDSSSSATSLTSASSSSSSETVSSRVSWSSKDVVIGFLTSFLATYTGNPRPSSPSSVPNTTSSTSIPSTSSASSTSSSLLSSSTTSTSSASSTSSTSSTPKSSTTTWSTPASTPAAEPTSATFKLSGKSQLASTYVSSKKPRVHRRLLVWQDDKSDLIATEWFGSGKVHYRIKDKLGSEISQAKHGTPLAMTASDSGTIHAFFLDTKDAITHLYETAAGEWKTGTVQSQGRPVVAARFSPLSAALHRSSEDSQLLVVAYEGLEQKLRLAMNHEPKEETEWQLADVTSLDQAVAGQSDWPCFSLAGDWQNTFGGTEESHQRLLMVVLSDDVVVPWACSTGFSDALRSRIGCQQLNGTFQDDRGKGITASPPPQQLGWIRLKDAGGDNSTAAGYDYSLLCLNADGTVQESHVAAGEARRDGPGLDTKMPVRAMSTTDEAILFAASGEEVYIYRLDKDSWEWSSEGSLLSR